MLIGDLHDADVGRRVIYRPRHTKLNHFNTLTGLLAYEEEGHITSWNQEYVFVRYAPDEHSKATNPRDLRLADAQ